MRVLLTSDWHIGKNLFAKNLLEEQAKFFNEEFFPLLREVKPDLLVVAGDIFDRPAPDLESLSLFEELIKKLHELKINSLFILGNHDSRRASIHSELLKSVGIFLVGNLSYFFKPFVFQDPAGDCLYVYALPYLSIREYEEEAGALNAERTSEAIERLLVNSLQVRGRPAILVSHLAVASAIFTGEELPLKGLSPEYVLPESLFSGFDLVLLGHLHRFQIHGKKFIYPGAPLPYSFEAAGLKQGVTLLEIKNGSLISAENIELRKPYILKVYCDFFSNLTGLPRDTSLVKVVLKDGEPISDAEKELKRIFPKLIVLCYEEDEKTLSPANLGPLEENIYEGALGLDPRVVFKDFCGYLHRADPKVVSEEEKEQLYQIFDRYYQKFLEEVEANAS